MTKKESSIRGVEVVEILFCLQEFEGIRSKKEDMIRYLTYLGEL